MIELVQVETAAHLREVRQLFTEYTEDLGFDLDFQDYDDEITHLPGAYTPPSGRLYIALYDGAIAGCIALRKLDETTCEMKRMYVRTGYRRKGVGKDMALRVIDDARRIGYSKMRLDTIDTMDAAIALYRHLGFNPIPPYRYNPMKGAYFLELVL
jgi:ribosomal protein S18 acetylase RimI-like enzyme